MSHYELLACRNRRWVADQVVRSKNEAIGLARDLVKRDPLVSAVRVLMVDDQANGMTERPVCIVRASKARDPERGSEGARRDEPAGSAGWTTAAHPMPRRPRRRRRWNRDAVRLTAALVVVALGIVGLGIAMPKQRSAFDLPDAQKPHMLRNSFTGEFSR